MNNADFSPTATPPWNPPPLAWPAPPCPSYGAPQDNPEGVPCDVDALNGHTRSFVLVSLDEAERMAYVHSPPARSHVALRFEMLRRIRLTHPQTPLPGRHGDRLRQRFSLTLSNGHVVHGQTIGHVENGLGLFLFHPLGNDDSVERVFYPREAYQALQIGGRDKPTPANPDKPAARAGTPPPPSPGVASPQQLMEALEQQSRMPMVRIGEALTTLGLISPEQLAATLEAQRSERGTPLGEMLVREGLISRGDLQMALARKMGFPVVDLANFPVEAVALHKVPFTVAYRLNALPLMYHPGLLVVAVEDPSRRSAIDELEFISQSKVMTALASASQLSQALPVAYARIGLNFKVPGLGKAPAHDGAPATASELLESLEQSSALDDDNAPQIEQTDNSLVRLINTMIIEAHNQGVSDIHIETYPTRRKVRIRFRKEGQLSPYLELPHTYRSALVARIKIMCDLDISERRKPQDGKINFARFSVNHPLELRVATIPTQQGAEDVVLRLLSSAKPLTLESLQLSPENHQQLQEAIEHPYGMVLCVGPTGSGKTTTLHSLLQHLNTPERKIWTAEDPIEITNPDLRQVQVNPRIDWTFAKALRSFLRADPDVIMVGEIRDQETAQVAIEASLTGHLVLSTLHTNNSTETVTRLLDMGMDPFNFADSLLAVLAQRLARRWCPKCRRSEAASEDYVQVLLHEYLRSFPAALRPTPEAVRADWARQYGQDGQILRYHAPGCPHCGGTGLKGRLGLHELLVVGPEVRHLIQTRGRSEEIQLAAMTHSHFRTLRQDGIHKVLQGLTSLEEVRANCNI